MKELLPSPRSRPSGTTKLFKNAFGSNQRRTEFIIPHLMPVATTLLVSATPDVDARMLALLTAYCVAAGKEFLPFGAAKASQVFYFSSKVDPSLDWNRLSLIHDRDPHSSSQTRASMNLCLYNRHESGDEPAYLNSRYDQEWFARTIPSDTALVVFDNVGAFTRPGKSLDSVEGSDSFAFLERLNAEGIAVLLIDPNSKKGNPLSGAVIQNDTDNVIGLSYDHGAPHEFGGGFHLERQKRDDNDTNPRRFQFWWKVLNGQLDFGWELRKPLEAKDAKQAQILARQMKVDQLLSEGKSQREIATLLELDASTISRDVAKLNKRAADGTDNAEDVEDSE